MVLIYINIKMSLILASSECCNRAEHMQTSLSMFLYKAGNNFDDSSDFYRIFRMKTLIV